MPTEIKSPHVAALTLLGAGTAIFFVAGVSNDDMLKMYVGSLRIAHGQLPYRDFFPQVSPLANFLAAPVFAVLPVGISALLLAMALNVAAALAMWRLVLHQSGDRATALVAGVLSACWYSQIGGYYFDQLAYLFALCAFLRYVLRPSGVGAGATEGILLGCAVLTKQSIGVFAAGGFCVTVLAFDGWRAVLRPRFLIAGATTGAILLLYLASVDGIENFYTYAIVFQQDLARERKNLWRLVTDFLTPWNLDLVSIVRERQLGRLSFYPVVLAVYLSYLAVALRRPVKRPLLSGYAFLLLSTVWAAATPGRLYTHVTFGFGAIAAITAFLLAGRHRRAALWATTVLFVAIAAAQAIRNLYPEERHASPVATRDLWPLHFDQRQADAIRAAAPIVSTDQSYALFGGTFLNAVPLALHRPPLDPQLFYEYHSMIPRDAGGLRDWQAMMIRRFEERQPQFLVIGFPPPDAARDSVTVGDLAELPQWQSYIAAHYPTVVSRAGQVSVLARR